MASTASVRGWPLAGVALFAWVIHDDRLHRLPPVVVRTTRMQFLVGLAMYGVAFLLSWVSPVLALALPVRGVGAQPRPPPPASSTSRHRLN